MRDHAPGPDSILSILGIARCYEGLLAEDSYRRAAQNQPTTQTGAPRPGRRNPRQGEQAKRRVDRMPDVMIGSASHQASFSRIRRYVIAAPTEGDPRPYEEQKCQHLGRDDERRR